MPPAEEAARAENWLYEGRSGSAVDPHEQLAGFIDRTNRVLHLVEGFMPEVRWLSDAETLTYLHSCVSTKRQRVRVRSEEHTSELQSLMRISYAVFCLKKNTTNIQTNTRQ